MSKLMEASPEAVKQVFESAFMQASLDEDGDVAVKVERFTAYVVVKEGRPIMKVLYQFNGSGAKESLELFRALNEFNKAYSVYKAFWVPLGTSSVVRFETDLRVDGGFSPAALVATVRQGESLISKATELHQFLA